MDSIDLTILIVAVLLIVVELWYFAGPKRKAAGHGKPVAQDVRINIRHGFNPALVLVEHGRPVRLQFFRDETSPSSAEVRFDTLNISKALPEFVSTTVEFIPKDPGDYVFRCGSGYVGRVVALPGLAAVRQNLGRGHQKHG